MKKFNKNPIATTLVLLFVSGFMGPVATFAAGPAAVDLLSAGNFTILSKTGITNTGSHSSAVTGNIGSSPTTAASMNNVFCSEIAGTIYGVDAAYVGNGNQTCFAGNPPLSNKTLVDNAILDMETAYSDAAGRTLPTATELGAGNIGGMTLAPGLYKWSSDVTIPTNVTLSGDASDVWIFQIAGNLDVSSAGSVAAGTKIILSGGAVASNVFWQVGGVTGATLGTYSTFNGNILASKQIIIQTGAVLHGRALAQTQVTLDSNVVTTPAPSMATPSAVKVTIRKYIDGVMATPESAGSIDFPMSATWNAENIGAGSGQFNLSATGFNGNPTPYQAITSDMTPGSDYSTYEITSNDSQFLPIGSACVIGKYVLDGYQTSPISFADAASSTIQTSTPSFTDLMSNQYVIVRDSKCTPPDPDNLSPFFLDWSPVLTATATEPYSYDVDAFDPESDPLIFSLVSSTPSGMTINASSGLIEWTPTTEQASSTPYMVTVRVSDPTHSISRDYGILVNAISNSTSTGDLHGDVVQDNGVLHVDSVSIVKSTSTADGTFAGGWRYVFHITTPTNEPKLGMKFADWVNGINTSTIPVANNMRISSLQADNGGATVLLTAANTYSVPKLNMTSDLNPAVSGRQVDVVVEVSIPIGTPAAIYSTSYGVQTTL